MSHFTWIDGSIVGLYIILTMIAGIAVRRYVGKVEHFLIAGREMNLYLGIASLAATEFGIVTCMYTSQSGYVNGFAGATPGILAFLAMFFVGYTGFCVKPLRDAGVMTIPELFQLRYGSRIRWLSGVVIVLGGLLNMGVFLRTGGDFLVAVCGFDARYLEITMTALLVSVAVYTILGGMLSVLVTDFLQFIVMSAGLLAVTILILMNVGWERLTAAVEQHYGAGGFNPFVHAKMGWEYVVANGMLSLAMVLTWQTTIQRLLAAKDTKTGRQVYTRTSFFFLCRWLIPVVWGIAALAYFSPMHNTVAAFLHNLGVAGLSVVTPDQIGNGTLLAMPRFLSQMVPVGLLGILVAAMLAADMSTDSSYMLTWSSVIYNDILAPFHKNKWTERRGLLISRAIVAVIGIFLLLYGLWYPLKGNLWDYLTVTANIYMSSMSVLLIACCYWKRANSWGAAGAIIFGAIVPSAFLVMEQLPSTAHFAKDIVGPHFSNIATYLIAGLAMVVGSLLKPGAQAIREERG